MLKPLKKKKTLSITKDIGGFLSSDLIEKPSNLSFILKPIDLEPTLARHLKEPRISKYLEAARSSSKH